jgi:hypothetical protein
MGGSGPIQLVKDKFKLIQLVDTSNNNRIPLQASLGLRNVW